MYYLKFIFVLLLFESRCIFSHVITKREAPNSTEVYQVKTLPDNGIEFIDSKPREPSLFEIIYYRIIKKPYEECCSEYRFSNIDTLPTEFDKTDGIKGTSNKDTSEGLDFDQSARPFTNGQGYQFMEWKPEETHPAQKVEDIHRKKDEKTDSSSNEDIAEEEDEKKPIVENDSDEKPSSIDKDKKSDKDSDNASAQKDDKVSASDYDEDASSHDRRKREIGGDSVPSAPSLPSLTLDELPSDVRKVYESSPDFARYFGGSESKNEEYDSAPKTNVHNADRQLHLNEMPTMKAKNNNYLPQNFLYTNKARKEVNPSKKPIYVNKEPDFKERAIDMFNEMPNSNGHKGRTYGMNLVGNQGTVWNDLEQTPVGSENIGVINANSDGNEINNDNDKNDEDKNWHDNNNIPQPTSKDTTDKSTPVTDYGVEIPPAPKIVEQRPGENNPSNTNNDEQTNLIEITRPRPSNLPQDLDTTIKDSNVDDQNTKPFINKANTDESESLDFKNRAIDMFNNMPNQFAKKGIKPKTYGMDLVGNQGVVWNNLGNDPVENENIGLPSDNTIKPHVQPHINEINNDYNNQEPNDPDKKSNAKDDNIIHATTEKSSDVTTTDIMKKEKPRPIILVINQIADKCNEVDDTSKNCNTDDNKSQPSKNENEYTDATTNQPSSKTDDNANVFINKNINKPDSTIENPNKKGNLPKNNEALNDEMKESFDNLLKKIPPFKPITPKSPLTNIKRNSKATPTPEINNDEQKLSKPNSNSLMNRNKPVKSKLSHTINNNFYKPMKYKNKNGKNKGKGVKNNKVFNKKMQESYDNLIKKIPPFNRISQKSKTPHTKSSTPEIKNENQENKSKQPKTESNNDINDKNWMDENTNKPSYDKNKLDKSFSDLNSQLNALQSKSSQTPELPGTYGMHLVNDKGYTWNDLNPQQQTFIDVGKPSDSNKKNNLDPHEENEGSSENPITNSDQSTESSTNTGTTIGDIYTNEPTEPITEATTVSENDETTQSLPTNLPTEHTTNDNLSETTEANDMETTIKQLTTTTEINRNTESSSQLDEGPENEETSLTNDRPKTNEKEFKILKPTKSPNDSNDKTNKKDIIPENKNSQNKTNSKCFLNKDKKEDNITKLELDNLLKKKEFWDWLSGWSNTYMEVLNKRVKDMVKEEVANQLKNVTKLCANDECGTKNNTNIKADNQTKSNSTEKDNVDKQNPKKGCSNSKNSKNSTLNNEDNKNNTKGNNSTVTETSNKPTEKSNTVNNNPNKKNTTNCTKNNTAKNYTAKNDTAKNDTAKNDTAKNDTVSKLMDKKDSANNGTADKDAVKNNTAKNETSPNSKAPSGSNNTSVDLVAGTVYGNTVGKDHITNIFIFFNGNNTKGVQESGDSKPSTEDSVTSTKSENANNDKSGSEKNTETTTKASEKQTTTKNEENTDDKSDTTTQSSTTVTTASPTSAGTFPENSEKDKDVTKAPITTTEANATDQKESDSTTETNTKATTVSTTSANNKIESTTEKKKDAGDNSTEKKKDTVDKTSDKSPTDKKKDTVDNTSDKSPTDKKKDTVDKTSDKSPTDKKTDTADNKSDKSSTEANKDSNKVKPESTTSASTTVEPTTEKKKDTVDNCNDDSSTEPNNKSDESTTESTTTTTEKTKDAVAKEKDKLSTTTASSDSKETTTEPNEESKTTTDAGKTTTSSDATTQTSEAESTTTEGPTTTAQNQNDKTTTVASTEDNPTTTNEDGCAEVTTVASTEACNDNDETTESTPKVTSTPEETTAKSSTPTSTTKASR